MCRLQQKCPVALQLLFPFSQLLPWPGPQFESLLSSFMLCLFSLWARWPQGKGHGGEAGEGSRSSTPCHFPAHVTHTCAHTQACIHTYASVCTHSNKHVHTLRHVYTPKHTHAHTKVCVHPHSNTHVHTLTHTPHSYITLTHMCIHIPHAHHPPPQSTLGLPPGRPLPTLNTACCPILPASHSSSFSQPSWKRNTTLPCALLIFPVKVP